MRTEGTRGGGAGARGRCDAGALWRGATLLLCAALASACSKGASDAEVKKCAKRLINEGFIEAPSMEAAAQEATRQCRETLESGKRREEEVNQAIAKAIANPHRPSTGEKGAPHSVPESELERATRLFDECMNHMPELDPDGEYSDQYAYCFYSTYKDHCRSLSLEEDYTEGVEVTTQKVEAECAKKVK